jgi:drug/metabolite transporter (DMT)-like permease
MFMGGLLLFAAVIAWATALMMSPHGTSNAPGTEHVRTVVVVFLRNSAIGTLILSALSAWLLFPSRRPRWPLRDWALIGLIGLLVLTSLYQLIWLRGVTG